MIDVARHNDPHRPRRVLLIEDDLELRDALSDVLGDRGHIVEAACDGVEGLRRMRAFRPDIIVLDLMMPRLDGWQFRVEQRSDPEMAKTPVVVISASSSPHASAVDADLYLHKPIDAETLIHAIEGVMTTYDRRNEFASHAQTARLAAVGTLAAGLAHEINNPLTYVLLQLSRARKLLVPGDGSMSRDAAKAIDDMIKGALDGAERIRHVTGAIRLFTDHDAVGTTPISTVDVRPAVSGALELTSHLIAERARLSTRFAGPCLVTANQGQLAQVLLNVVTNAAQAIDPGAPDDNEIIIAAGSRLDRVVIEISDTGCGIPPALIGRVFEPFFTTKPVGEGTGLGLSISYGIVASFGGTIEVTSKLGVGTTFRLVLPAAGPTARDRGNKDDRDASRDSSWQTTTYRS